MDDCGCNYHEHLELLYEAYPLLAPPQFPSFPLSKVAMALVGYLVEDLNTRVEEAPLLHYTLISTTLNLQVNNVCLLKSIMQMLM